MSVGSLKNLTHSGRRKPDRSRATHRVATRTRPPLFKKSLSRFCLTIGTADAKQELADRPASVYEGRVRGWMRYLVPDARIWRAGDYAQEGGAHLDAEMHLVQGVYLRPGDQEGNGRERCYAHFICLSVTNRFSFSPAM